VSNSSGLASSRARGARRSNCSADLLSRACGICGSLSTKTEKHPALERGSALPCLEPLPRSNQTVAVGMRADPETNDGRALHDPQCAVAQRDPDRGGVALLVDFLDRQARVVGVFAQKQIGPSRRPPDIFWQVEERLTEPSCDAGFDQRRSSTERVSPR
jgi:hypothetical protein